MSRCPGATLATFLPRLVKQPLHTRLLAISNIVRKVGELHEAGIIHHDIKSDNVLVTKTGRASIVDLELSGEPGKVYLREPLPQQRRQKKKYEIYAPEFLQCHRSGPLMDVYSLGVMFSYVLRFIPTPLFDF